MRVRAANCWILFCLASACREPAPEPPPAAAPQDEGTGVLEVIARPVGARVFVDDEPRGEAPLRVAVSAEAQHLIRVEAEGFQPQTLNQTLSKDAQRTLRIVLKPAAAPNH